MNEKIAVSVLLASLVGGALFALPAVPEGPKTKVGGFDRAKVLPAFYRSEIWAKRMKSIKGEAEGASLQERAHKQLTGEVAIDEVLQPLEKEWAAIAREAGVAIIVEKTLYRDGTIELVDLSDKIASKFPPAAKGEK